MKPKYSKDDLVAFRLKKASDTLHEAKLIASQNMLPAAINRIYYSCFYAASALLLLHDITPKSHKGVRAMLGLHFIETGILSKDNGRFYNDTFEYRQNSDYEDFFIIPEDIIIEFIQKAEIFIQEINTLTKK